MSDGAIRINTELDTAQAEADLKGLERAGERTAKNLEKASNVSIFTNSSKSVKGLENNLKSATKEVEKMTKKVGDYDKMLAQYQQEKANIQASYEEMLKKAETDSQASFVVDMENKDLADLEAKWRPILDEAEEYNRKLKEAEERQKALANSIDRGQALGTASGELKEGIKNQDFADSITDKGQYNDVLSATQSRMEMIKNLASEIAQKQGLTTDEVLQTNQEYGNLQNRMNVLSSIQSNFTPKMEQWAGKLREVGSKYLEISSRSSETGAKLSLASAKAGVLGGALRVAGATVLTLSKGVELAKTGFQKMLPVIKKVGASVGAVARGMLGMRKNQDSTNHAIQRGVKQLSRLALSLFSIRSAYALLSRASSSWLSEQTELSSQIQGLWASLGAFLEPVIRGMVSMLTTALSYLNAFVKALTGVDVVAKRNANAIKKQQESTKGLSKAQEDANKQLAGFDEMNKLNDPNSGSDSGGGADSPINGIIDLDDVGVPDWLEKIREQFENGDWYGIGQTIANGLNNALSGIDWESIKAKSQYIGQSIAELINGFVENANWSLIGYTLGEGINTAINFLYGFVTTLNWRALGEGLGTGIDSAIKTIDWNKVADTLSGYFIGAFNMLSGAIQKIDWKNIGVTLIEFIKRIDWGGVASAVFEFLGSALGGATALLWGIIETIAKDIGSYFSEKIEEQGGNVVAGLWQGIKDAFKSVGTWIYDNICVPFIKGFKDAFQIKSPSKLMAEMGVYLIEGLLNGILSLKDKAKETWAKVKTWFSEIKGTVSVWFKDTKDSVSKKWKEITSNIKDKTAELKAKIPQKWSNLKSSWEGITKNIKDKTASMKAKIGTTWGNLKNTWNNLMSNFKDKTVTVKVTLTTIIDNLKSWLNKNFVNKFNDYMPNWLKLPKLAKGGIAYAPQMALIGEAGKEAVLPLENNTEWLDMLADRLNVAGGGNVTIPVYLDSRQIAKYTIDIANKKAFETNRSVIK